MLYDKGEQILTEVIFCKLLLSLRLHGFNLIKSLMGHPRGAKPTELRVTDWDIIDRYSTYIIRKDKWTSSFSSKFLSPNLWQIPPAQRTFPEDKTETVFRGRSSPAMIEWEANASTWQKFTAKMFGLSTLRMGQITMTVVKKLNATMSYFCQSNNDHLKIRRQENSSREERVLFCSRLHRMSESLFVMSSSDGKRGNEKRESQHS